MQSKQTIDVVIPPGVNDGATMQIRGEGNFDKNRLDVSIPMDITICSRGYASFSRK